MNEKESLAMIPYVVYETERYRAAEREKKLLAACVALAASLVAGLAAWLCRRFMSR